MATSYSLLQWQLGTEATNAWGTSVAATVKLMKILSGKLQPQTPVRRNVDMRASLGPGYIDVLDSISGKAALGCVATYEDLPYWLDGLFGKASPSGTDPYVRAYTAPLTAVQTAQNYSLYSGDGTNVYKLLGALVTKIKLSGKAGETDTEVKLDLEFDGKEVTTGALAELADRTVYPLLMSEAAIYIDALGGTIGTTQVQTYLRAFELSLDLSENRRRWYEGSLKPGTHVEGAWKAESNTLKLTLDFGATSKAYVDAALAATTAKLVRVKFTRDANHVQQLDFAGTIQNTPELMNEDGGVESMDLNLMGTVDAGAFANWFKASNTNQVATLA